MPNKILPVVICVVGFYVGWLQGGQVLKSLLRPWIENLDNETLQNFLFLDRGRLWGRISSLFWTLLFALPFVRFRKYNLGVSWDRRQFFKSGFQYGALLVLATILIPYALGSFEVTGVHSSAMVPTVCLYLFAMTLTAITEELAIRGVLMGEVTKIIGTHGAIVTTSLFFGYIHAESSTLYALMAGLIGIVLGYGRAWYGLLFPIGFHLAWNTIETVFFAGPIFAFKVFDIVLLGDRSTSPDNLGVITFPIIIAGFLLMVSAEGARHQIQST